MWFAIFVLFVFLIPRNLFLNNRSQLTFSERPSKSFLVLHKDGQF